MGILRSATSVAASGGATMPRAMAMAAVAKGARRRLHFLRFTLRRVGGTRLLFAALATLLVALRLLLPAARPVRAHHAEPDAWRLDSGGALPDAAKLAYFVQVGADSVALLPRLLDIVHLPRNVYVVHVDRKVDENARAGVVALVNESDRFRHNVYIMESEMVTYKGISMVLNTIAAMTLALEKDAHWHYFINLSGADYPLVSPEMQSLLLARPRVPPGRLNFISFFPEKEWKPYQFRVRMLHWDPAVVGHQAAGSRLRRISGMKDNLLEKSRAYDFVKAEAWMILSRPFVQFVVRSAFAKRMLLSHVHVLSAPEHYFADVLYNHPVWRRTLVPDGFRKVVWHHRNHRSGQHPYVLDKGESMYTFWQYIRATRSLFARKFSLPNSPLLARVDRELSGVGNRSDSTTTKARDSQQPHLFYANLVELFDSLTKSTLAKQRYAWPSGAYPPLPGPS